MASEAVLFPESCSVGRPLSDVLFKTNVLAFFFAPPNFAMVTCPTRPLVRVAESGPMLDTALRFVLSDPPRLISVSSGVEGLLGFKPEEFLSAKVCLRERIHSGDAELAKFLFSSDLHRPSDSFNIRLRHADGKIRCIKGNFTKSRSPKGEALLDLSLVDARTVNEPGDSILINSFKALIEQTADYIYIKNRNHVFLAASRNMPKLSESARDHREFTGKTDYDLIPEAVADRMYQLERRAFEEGRRTDEILQMTAQEGTKHWIDDRKYPIGGPDGQFIGIFGVAPDITENVEARERLREAQKIAGLGDYELDFREKIWKTSVELDTLLGIGANFDRSMDCWLTLVHPADRVALDTDLKEYLRSPGEPFDKEYRIIRQTDGAVRWVHTRGRLERDGQGTPHRLRGTVQDITEQKQAEDSLRESEEWLRDAQEIAGLSGYVLDIPNKKWIVSPELRTLLGIGEDYDRGFESVWPLIHPDDRPEMAKRLDEHFTGDSNSFDSEYRIVRHTDGAVRWVHTRGRLERDAQGNPIALRGAIQDITERKQAEAELRENRELLQLFIKHAPVALAMLDREMRYLAVSPGWREMHRLNGRELVGLSHYEIFPQLDEDWKEQHRRALGGETIPASEVSMTRPDGSLQWVRREIRPWFSGDGEVGGIIIFSEDVTERRRAEEELRASREQLQLFVEHAPVALAMFDREMRYLAVSKRWAEDHSADEREIIGRSHYEVNPDVPERWLETHRRGLTGEKQVVEEDRYVRANGTVQWIRWQIMPWQTADGTIGGIVMFYEDITERKLAEAALSENKELLQLFIDRAPAALAMFDREMRYLAVSRRWLEEYSLVGQPILGRCHYDVVPDIPERWKEVHRRGLAGETMRADEDRFERADGTVQWIEWEVVPWRSGTGSVGGIVLFADDITAKKQAEERLRLAASVFTGAREGITITDLKGTILDVNNAFTRITGYTREEVVGKNPRLLKSGLQSKDFYDKMWGAIQRDGHWSGEIWNRSKSGDIFAEMLTINTIRDADGKPTQYVSLFSDITEIKRHEQQLEHIAHYDPLTGLPNRVLFTNRLRQAMAQTLRNKQMLAVAYFDLDGFKAINDEHGHSLGDALLTAIAFRVRRVMREGDTLGRLGGDEFAAVLLDVDAPESVAPAVKRMLDAAAEEVQIGEIDLRLSACCGVTFYPQNAEVDADVLLRQAGQAMYQAKLAGRNRSQNFDASEDFVTRSRHENIEHVRLALTSGQFVLHYQPKVNMRTGRIVGAEALLRWQHPERGLLPPGMFLPVIEDHPLSVELGEWVIENALTQMEEWQGVGFDLPVSVNLSPLELQQPDFADRLRARLAAHPKVKASSLEFEVLETSALQDLAQSSQMVAACRALGVAIALDDFGIGYSSLTYLKRLPANVLKIDQSFVRDMLDDPENLNILEGIMGLAAAFQREVIAEGVETVEHGVMLLQMGCELAQGYGIARPMPANALQAWAATWKPDPRWAEVPPVNAGNRHVLYACVEHRAWLSAFEACLMGKRASPPPLDASRCRIGSWLRTEKQTARGAYSSIQAIEALHQELHTLASEILDSQSEGRNTERLAQLQQLHHLHEKCMNRLRTFTRGGSGRGRKRSHIAPAQRTTRY